MDTVIKNEELYTVGCDHALITWGTPQQRANTTIYIGEEPGHLVRHTFSSGTEFHWAELSSLKPSTRYWYQVESNGSRGSLNSFTTLTRPGGKYLFSFAILSDLHVSYEEASQIVSELYFGKLVEHSRELFVQCILDSKQRNIDLAVITGDLTDSASQMQYSGLRNQLLPNFGVTPYLPCVGNHDKYVKHSGMGQQGFLQYVAHREKTYTCVVFRDYRFLLIDSCRQDDNRGYIDPDQLRWLESKLQKGRGRPSFLFLHHPSNGPDVWYGIENHQAFQKLIKLFPDVQGVFCGHIHRNKVTTSPMMTGCLPYVEVPATVQFPCAYAVVRVYEKGFTYNSYKVSRLDLSEMSRERFILKSGGKGILTWYGLGGIGDRNFSYISGRLFQPKQHELSMTVQPHKAVGIYRKALSSGGASLAPAAERGKMKVVLGRYDSLQAAAQAQRERQAYYGLEGRIITEGAHYSIS